MASDMKKPMGITVLYPDQIAEKMWILPVETLYGVGKSTKAVFHKMHIYTIGDLARYDLSELIRRLGEKKARTVHQHANGIDETPVIPNEESETKSVGNEITFSTDITDFCELKKEILTLAESVGWRLRKLKTYGKTITLKIKYDDFSLVTRSKTLDLYMDQTDLIYEEAIQLLNKHWQKKRGVRLLGITVSNLDQEKETEQLCLFDLKPKADPKKEKLDQTIDALRGKYGYNILRRASLLDAKHKVKKIQS
jgi:DNA polymerase-4